MRSIAVLALPLLVLGSIPALAQPCPVNLRPVGDNNLGYRHRPAPDRCEGFYTSPVSGEELELLSFLEGRIALDQNPAHSLLITAPDLRALGSPPVTVVARALPLHVYYRMDATLPSGGSMQWPIGEVVLPGGLDPGKIGVIGSIRTSEGDVYVPLRISAPNSHEALRSPSLPEITFRAPVDLEIFQWRLYEAERTVPAWNRYAHAVSEGDPVSLTLDTPAGKEMTLDVATRPSGADYIEIRYKIFRP
jgi:hypothetical protein